MKHTVTGPAPAGFRRSASTMLVLAAAVAIGGVVHAQETPFTPQNPFETTEVRSIELLAGGLTPPSYPALQGGELLVLSAVIAGKEELPAAGVKVELDGKSVEPVFLASRPPAADATGKEGAEAFRPLGWYIALFDTTIADPLEIQRWADGLAGQLDGWLGPEDRMAILVFDGRVRVLAPFTADPEAIRAALKRIPDRPVYDINDFFGSRVKVTARGERNRSTSELDRSDDRAQHNFAAQRFFEEMRRLAEALSAVPGRKQLMLFSGGLNRKFLTTEEVVYLRMVDLMIRNTVSFYTFYAVGDDFGRRLIEEEGIKRKRLERAGSSELKQAMRFLKELAENTGGIYRDADAEPAAALGAVARDGRNHYLIGIRRSPGDRTGNFISVNLEVTGRIEEVRAPVGFYDR